MIRHTTSLRKRITLTILTGISILLLTFGVAGYYIVQSSIEHSVSEKLELAHLIGSNIDNIIRDNISRLYDISLSGKVDLYDNNPGPEREALKTAYRYSIFTDGVFLLDLKGNIIANYPAKIRKAPLTVLDREPISKMLSQGKPVVSNVHTFELSSARVIFVLVPLKDLRGKIVGIAGGEIDPANPSLTRTLGLVDLGRDMFIDVSDSNGVIISSSNASRILTNCNRDGFFTTVIRDKKSLVTTCHSCHSPGTDGGKVKMVLAFAPLGMAPWGVSIQEPEIDVFAAATRLKWTFLGLGCFFIGIAFILTVGISRSIVDPLKDLIRGTDSIAKGDLTRPVPIQGSDEIGTLSQSFETMRLKLVESIKRITEHTVELESLVQERTRKINESQKQSELLLQKVISSQEDERKRIARELHDDTLQAMSAAIMRIDMCKIKPPEQAVRNVDDIRAIIVTALDDVVGIIQNLRPTLLDDLGLVAAMKSLLDVHLGENGIMYFLNTSGVGDQRFRPELEITLFRIVQEAVVNIARHAQAENAFISLSVEREEIVHVEIEDDGEGFDLNDSSFTLDKNIMDRRGLGLMGMRERVMLIGGKIGICSTRGLGTRIELRIPIREGEVLSA